MVIVRTVEDAYKIALKAEEKLAKKHSQQNKGQSLNIGKGVAQDKAQKPKCEAEKPHSHPERGGSSRGRHAGGRNSFPIGRGRGRGGEVRCYACGKQGICLGIVPRGRKEAKLTFWKHRSAMLRHKV
jgi:hypothetical protein